MKFPVIPAACLLAASFLTQQAWAQEKKDTVPQPLTTDTSVTKDDVNIENSDSIPAHPKKSYFGLTASYVNDNVFLGRKDTVAIPYLTPKIGYYHKSGLFAEAAAGFISTPGNTGLDLFSLAAGYNIEAGNYDGALTLSKFYYSSQSTNVKSEMTGSAEYVNGFDFGFIKPTLMLGANFGTKTDMAAAFGLEHSFYLINDKMEITPTAMANGSTQNYYNSYYKVRKYNPKRKLAPLPKGIKSISGEVQDAAAFKVLDYELSLPIHFETGKFTFAVIPVYAVPVHPAVVNITTTLNNGVVKNRTATENLSNTFFGTLELAIKF